MHSPLSGQPGTTNHGTANETTIQMLGRHHTMVEPLRTLTARGTVTARTREGAVVVPAPVDYVAWTQRAAEFARRPDLNAQQHSVWLTGKVLPRAQRELTALGWTVHEEVRKEKP
jgi:hypothetical protein